MSRPPKSKTAEYRRFLTPEEAAEVDWLDDHIWSLQERIAPISKRRRLIVERAKNRWQRDRASRAKKA